MNDNFPYLSQLSMHVVKPGLERIQSLLELLGNPESSLKSVIIGGTNGKGSVTEIMSNVLKACGYRVGKYTSPHLVRVNERINIDGRDISDPELVGLLERIERCVLENQIEQPSYFEVLTACAFLYFAEQEVDIALLEVGMGGCWDATNVAGPMLSVITSIGMDHTEYLGSDLSAVAREKSGIVKPGVPVVCGARGEPSDIIHETADQTKSTVYQIDRDFSVRGEDTDNFSYTGIDWGFNDLESSLLGRYQLGNIACALAGLEILQTEHGYRIEESNIRAGLKSVNWPGRFELISNDPPIILDGAHNAEAASALTVSIKQLFGDLKFVFVVGMLKNKDHEGFLSEITGVASNIIFTTLPGVECMAPDKLSAIGSKYMDNLSVADDCFEAYNKALESGEPVCVTGSLYLVGALRQAAQCRC